MSQSKNGTMLPSVNGRGVTVEPDAQAVPKAERRQFSAEYKARILAEADSCTERGQIGALLRREGLYSSHLDKWRKQRARGQLGPQKRGPKADPQAAEIARLQREIERLQGRLQQAETIIEVQKNSRNCLGCHRARRWTPSRHQASRGNPDTGGRRQGGLRDDGDAAQHVVSGSAASCAAGRNHREATPADASPGAEPGRKGGGAGSAQWRTLSRPGSAGGLRHTAGRGTVPVPLAHDVPGAG